MKAFAFTASAVAVALLTCSCAAQDESVSRDFGSDGSGGSPREAGGSMMPTWSTSSSGSNGLDAGSIAVVSSPPSTDSSSSSIGSFAGSIDSSAPSVGTSAPSADPWTPSPRSADAWTAPPNNGAYNDDNSLYYYPDIDGGGNLNKRKKYYFNPSDGFSLTTTDTTTGVKPGDCPHANCVHVVFESDYGAMSTFDAFYLDSYESVGGPIGTSSFTVGDHAPLVLGRFPKESIDRLGANWSQVFNWNDTRRTTWTFFPTRNSLQLNEIDLTLSLKQVYTALPNFYAQYADEMNMGPLYSSNLTDQVVIRINAHHENVYTSASGMLPIVVNHTGSQLVDINITSTRLYADARNDSNEIQLTVKIGRRKYGGLAPWIPVRASPCFFPPSWFSACLEANAFGLRRATDDLLSYKTISNALDIRPIVKMCADSASQYYSNTPYPSGSGSWGSGGSQQSSSRGAMDAGSSDGDGSRSSQPPPLGHASWDGVAGVWPGDPLHDLEVALRDTLHRYPRCALNDVTMKSDGQGVTLHHEPATTRIDFGVPSFSFYFVMEIDNETVTTHVFTSDMSEKEIAQGIYSALPAGREWLQVSVRYGNNMDEIQDVRRRNRWTMEAYEETLRWTGEWTPSEGSSSDDSSAGLDRESQSAGSQYQSSGNSDSGGSIRPMAGSFRPKEPSLLPIPAEQYSVFINFENLVLVPRVLAVFSPQSSMTSLNNMGKLQLEVVPLLQLDVSYAPPSTELDLEWRNEPLWKTRARRLLRKSSITNTCNKCFKAFERCLLDEDCVFGVNSHFAGVMAWGRWANQTSNATDEIDIRDVVWQARAFFPGKGFEKLQDLLLCWAKNACLLNEPPMPVYDDSTGKVEKEDRTVFVFEPTQIDLMIERYKPFAIYANGDKQYWPPWYGCDPNKFQEFISRNVLRAEPSYVRSFMLQTNCNDWLGNQPWEFRFTWPNGFVDPMRFDVKDGGMYEDIGSSSVVKPWTLTIRSSRASLWNNKETRSPWSRFQSWLNIFRSVPFGLGLGSSNSSNVTDWPEPRTTFPLPAPTNPSAICPACAHILLTCASDYACLTAARAWLVWVLPGPSINSTSDWDGFARTRWLGDPFGNDSIAGAYREPLLKLVACLSKHSCAVGYGHLSNETNAVVPTTLRMRAMRKLVSVKGSFGNVWLSYGDLAPVVLIPRDDPQPYMDQVKAVYDEDIAGSSLRTNWIGNEEHGVNFTGSIEALERLRISWYLPWGVIKPDAYSVRFQSPSGVKPPWNYLLSWFGIGTGLSNDTQCAACIPKLRVCYYEDDCWRQVHDYALPVLERKQGWLNQWSEFVSTDHTRYKTDIGSTLFNYAQHDMSKASWSMLMDILRCLSLSRCDVAMMDSAVEPPATAYVPSYTKIQPAYIEVMLYPDTTIDLNGQQYSHAGSMSQFESFIRSGLGDRSDLSFYVQETTPDMYAGPGSTSYNVTFSDTLYERLPWISVRGSGQKPITDSRWYRDPYAQVNNFGVIIESMNQSPQWGRLNNLLSVAPLTNNADSTPDWLLDCEAAQDAKHACFDDYSCKYQVAQSSVVSMMKRALLKSTPAYNPESGVFEVDLTVAGQTQNARFVAMVEQGARCAATNATMTSRPIFQRGRVHLVRPFVGPLIVRGIYYYNYDLQYDQDWNETEFSDFVSSSWAFNGYASCRSWAKTDDQIEYDLEVTGCIGMIPSMLGWRNETSGEYVESTSMPSRLVFQSQSFDVFEAALPWLNWLSS